MPALIFKIHYQINYANQPKFRIIKSVQHHYFSYFSVKQTLNYFDYLP